jgi:hypothetical protein
MDTQPWFEADDYQDRDCYRAMSQMQRHWVDSFRRDGLLILEQTVADEALANEIVASLVGKYTGSPTGYSAPGRVQDAWQTVPAVGRLAGSAIVADALQVLYQRAPVPFQTLNFERGTQQRAHSDTIHFNSLPFGFMCGVWVALEDIDANNGPLFYYPGSQRLPVFHMRDLGLEPGADSYQQYEDRVAAILEEKGFESRQALVRRGQAVIWSANIFHGGSRVLDAGRTRLSQVTHYYFPGCIYYTPLLSAPEKHQWMLRQVKDIRTGEVVPSYLGLPQPRRKRRSLFDKLFRSAAS